jgi:hypothetical protein
VEGPIENVTEKEMEKALKEMKNCKAPEPSSMTIDMLKKAGRTDVKELTHIY